MDISVIIRAKNEAEKITEVLRSVFSQKINTDFEVIVVDSGSTDATLDIVAKFPCKVIKIPDGDFSYGLAMNRGAEAAQGKFLVYLSAHSRPTSEFWLKNLIGSFSDDKIAGVFGRNVPVKGVNPFDEWRMQDTFPMEENRSVEKYMFNSGNCAISKSVWEKFHFDERIPFAEDRLWAKAVLENGFKIKYLPAASAFHSHWFSQAQLFNRMRWQGFAVKAIYGNSCRYDGIFWMSFAYVYFVCRDILYFVINGYFKFLPRIFVYRFIHLKGLYCGAKAYVRNEKI